MGPTEGSAVINAAEDSDGCFELWLREPGFFWFCVLWLTACQVKEALSEVYARVKLHMKSFVLCGLSGIEYFKVFYHVVEFQGNCPKNLYATDWQVFIHTGGKTQFPKKETECMWVKRKAQSMRGIGTATVLMQLCAFCFEGNRGLSIQEG